VGGGDHNPGDGAALAYAAGVALEDMEGYGGYASQKPYHIRLMACCSPPQELDVAKDYAEQPNPYDGPKISGWKEFVETNGWEVNVSFIKGSKPSVT
jgi:hypothetical protein